MKRQTIPLLLALWMAPLAAAAQSGPEIDVPSSETWKFMQYGLLSPSLYTGAVDVRIPFFTYRDPDFEIPIDFCYTSNGLRPNMQTGVLGLEWVMNVGGCITREVRGMPDEESGTISRPEYYAAPPGGSIGSPLPEESWGQAHGFLETCEFTQDSLLKRGYTFCIKPWNGVDILTYGITPPGGGDLQMSGDHYDAEPDIFRFNFLGYSGSFHLWHGRSVVVFDTNVPSSQFDVSLIVSGDMIWGAQITVGNGYRYLFGKDGDSRFVETHATAPDGDPYIGRRRHTAWKLYRIIAPNGRTVTFEYAQQYRAYNCPPLSHYNAYAYLVEGASWGNAPDTQNRIMPNVCESRLLDGIVVDGDTIARFSYVKETVLEDSYQYSNERLLRLQRIRITNSQGRTVKSADFEFFRPTKGNPIALLRKIAISGEGEYEFEYEGRESETFPVNGTFSVDHWGYYNGKLDDVSSPTDLFASAAKYPLDEHYDQYVQGVDYRACDAEFARLGMLRRIRYPTGGYSLLEYEPNRYAKAVVRTSQTAFRPTLVSCGENRIAGGVRLCRVVNYDSDATEIDRTSYRYVAEDGSTSSGIRLRDPRYTVSYVTRHSLLRPLLIHTTSFRSADFNFYDQTMHEYARVEEVRSDGSKTVHLFDNYERTPDLWTPLFHEVYIRSCLDRGHEASTLLTPPSSKKFARGRLLEIHEYDASGRLLTRTARTYASAWSSRPVMHLAGEYACEVPRLKIENNVVRTLSTDYFDTGAFTRMATFAYDPERGALKRELRIDAHSDTLAIAYTYAADLAAPGNIYQSMVAKNLLTDPVKTERYRNGALIGGEEYIYEEIDTGAGASLILPVEQRIYNPLSKQWERTKSCAYNRLGRLIQTTDANGIATSYIWGYKGNHPVARIDNATAERIATLGGAFASPQELVLPGPLSEAEERALRTIPNAAVTTYSYEPLVGLTRSTGPEGTSISYQYTPGGKLRRILDDAGSPVQRYDYSAEP